MAAPNSPSEGLTTVLNVFAALARTFDTAERVSVFLTTKVVSVDAARRSMALLQSTFAVYGLGSRAAVEIENAPDVTGAQDGPPGAYLSSSSWALAFGWLTVFFSPGSSPTRYSRGSSGRVAVVACESRCRTGSSRARCTTPNQAEGDREDTCGWFSTTHTSRSSSLHPGIPTQEQQSVPASRRTSRSVPIRVHRSECNHDDGDNDPILDEY
ncbi:hypothetical protein DFH09DRAFT_1335151 [Mycena vulgaris]|nr:hypothetical protein DFH09DRAFT_1335151 [Mycena vulgaris]